MFAVAGATVVLHPIILYFFSPTSALTLTGHHLHKILNLIDGKIKHEINEIYLNKKSLVKQRILNSRPICTSKCRGLKKNSHFECMEKRGKKGICTYISINCIELPRYYKINV